MFPTAPGNDHAKFFETAKTADVWLLASTNYDKMLNTDFTSSKFNMSNFTALLETMPAYQNGAIYDFQKNGQNDWFESRLAEPDVVLEDLIDIISPLASDGHKRVWWRNVKTEAVGGAEVVLCDDVNTPLLLKADACGKRGDAATATDSGKVSKRQAPRDTSRAAQPECVTWMETSNINAAGTTGNQPLELSAAGRAEMSLLAIAAAALVAAAQQL